MCSSAMSTSALTYNQEYDYEQQIFSQYATNDFQQRNPQINYSNSLGTFATSNITDMPTHHQMQYQSSVQLPQDQPLINANTAVGNAEVLNFDYSCNFMPAACQHQQVNGQWTTALHTTQQYDPFTAQEWPQEADLPPLEHYNTPTIMPPAEVDFGNSAIEEYLNMDNNHNGCFNTEPQYNIMMIGSETAQTKEWPQEADIPPLAFQQHYNAQTTMSPASNILDNNNHNGFFNTEPQNSIMVIGSESAQTKEWPQEADLSPLACQQLYNAQMTISPASSEGYCNIDNNNHNGFFNTEPQNSIMMIGSESAQTQELSTITSSRSSCGDITTAARKRKRNTSTPNSVVASRTIVPSGGFKCIPCGKEFTRICYLTQHNKSHHSGVYPYRCEICGKRFQVENVFKIHQTKHKSVDKDHKCQLCPKQFHYKTDLRRHIDTVHTRNNQHLCDICNKSFSRNDHLRKHLATHNRIRAASKKTSQHHNE